MIKRYPKHLVHFPINFVIKITENTLICDFILILEIVGESKLILVDRGKRLHLRKVSEALKICLDLGDIGLGQTIHVNLALLSVKILEPVHEDHEQLLKDVETRVLVRLLWGGFQGYRVRGLGLRAKQILDKLLVRAVFVFGHMSDTSVYFLSYYNPYSIMIPKQIYKTIDRYAFVGIICCIMLYIIWQTVSYEGYTNQDLRKIHTTLLHMWSKTKPIFEKYRIKYWAHAGTLLGSVREGKIIDWDDDMDIGTIREDYKRLQTDPNIHRDMSDAGLHILGKERSDNGLLKIVMKRKDDDYTKDKIFIDIMCYHLDKDKYVLSCWKEKLVWSREYYKKNEVDSLVSRPLNFLYINTIKNPEECLRRFYGDDWETPKQYHDHESEVNLS